MYLGDKVFEHLFGDFEVGYDAVLKRSDGGNITRSLAEHSLGLSPDGYDSAPFALGLYGYDTRLVAYDALALDVDERAGSAEIDGKVV